MYYLMDVEEKIRIPANMLNMDINDAAKKVLRDSYERKIFRNFGFVLNVDDVTTGGDGVIVPGDSNVYYTAKFKALVFNAVINEVLEAEAKEIVEFGSFVGLGPIDGLLHFSQIPGDKFVYDKKSKSLSSPRSKRSIKKGDILLIKVSTVSLKGNASDSKIGLTMRSEGLGKPEWEEDDTKKKKKKKEAPDK
jgi:DNA-directed RNA polymerase subunit E'